MTSQSWKMLAACTKIVQYKRIKKKYTVTLADIWQSDPQILQPTWTRSPGMKMLDFHNKMKGTRCKKEKNQSKYFRIVAFQLFISNKRYHANLYCVWTRIWTSMKMPDFHNKMKGTRCKKGESRSKYFRTVEFQPFIINKTYLQCKLVCFIWPRFVQSAKLQLQTQRILISGAKNVTKYIWLKALQL